MNSIHCIVVDDEPLSLEVMEKYISDTPSLNLMALCHDAYEALEVLKNGGVDLVFLDVNMPKLSGIQMIKSIKDPPFVIFTTAYPEYAVEGFEVDALDYLLKPFDYERFLRAVNKIPPVSSESLKLDNVLWLKSDKKLHKINISDVLYIEAAGDYLKVKTPGGNLIIYERMGEMEKKLEEFSFCRVHRSFIVSISKIEFIEGNRIKIGEDFIPVGKSYRDKLHSKIQ